MQRSYQSSQVAPTCSWNGKAWSVGVRTVGWRGRDGQAGEAGDSELRVADDLRSRADIRFLRFLRIPGLMPALGDGQAQAWTWTSSALNVGRSTCQHKFIPKPRNYPTTNKNTSRHPSLAWLNSIRYTTSGSQASFKSSKKKEQPFPLLHRSPFAVPMLPVASSEPVS